uniref:Uncharacterized protein n=1 Tax=Avena sativa TaxID=4498 RepID=A0ACD5W7X8_AVESA
MDEFTFPTVPGGGQCKLAPFPPPWFLAALSEDDDEDDSGGSAWGGDDERMDMLWEDFNEELARAPPVCPLSPFTKGGGGLMTMTMMKAGWLDDGDGGEGYGGVAEKGKRGRHMVVRRRRWSLLVMLRLLKKLFLVKKSRNQQRTTPI